MWQQTNDLSVDVEWHLRHPRAILQNSGQRRMTPTRAMPHDTNPSGATRHQLVRRRTPYSHSAKLGMPPHGVDLYGSVDARLQSINHPPEKSTFIKGSRTIDHPIVDIKANPLTNERGLQILMSLLFYPTFNLSFKEIKSKNLFWSRPKRKSPTTKQQVTHHKGFTWAILRKT